MIIKKEYKFTIGTSADIYTILELFPNCFIIGAKNSASYLVLMLPQRETLAIANLHPAPKGLS